MKPFILISLSLFLFTHTYDRNAVVNYAKTYWNTVNHKCGSSYLKCTPIATSAESTATTEVMVATAPTLLAEWRR